MILGLDISTSCTGWCVLDSAGSFVAMDAIHLNGTTSFYQKAQIVLKRTVRSSY